MGNPFAPAFGEVTFARRYTALRDSGVSVIRSIVLSQPAQLGSSSIGPSRDFCAAAPSASWAREHRPGTFPYYKGVHWFSVSGTRGLGNTILP